MSPRERDGIGDGVRIDPVVNFYSYFLMNYDPKPCGANNPHPAPDGFIFYKAIFLAMLTLTHY
jgi:hypothetical protein